MKTTYNRLKSAIFFEYLPMTITGIGILACAIAFKQSFIKILPLFFSLFIMLFNSRAKRIGFLLGSLNSLLYMVIYFIEGIFGSALSTLFGIIMMMTAFFCWKEDGKGNDTTFRRLSNKWRAIFGSLFVVAWTVSIIILSKAGGKAVIFDAFVFVSGFVVPVLNIRAYIESPFLNALGCFSTCLLWGQIIILENNLSNLTFFIYGIYSLYMVVRTFFKWLSTYKLQMAELESQMVNDAKN